MVVAVATTRPAHAAPDANAPLSWDLDCQEVGIGEAYVDSAYNQIPVLWLLMDGLGFKANDPDRLAKAQVEVNVISAPKRGELRRSDQGQRFAYAAPAKTAEGMDMFTLQAKATDASGHRRTYLLNYSVAVVAAITNEALPSACDRWAGVRIPPQLNQKEPPRHPKPQSPAKNS